jgi:hypothetical protein
MPFAEEVHPSPLVDGTVGVEAVSDVEAVPDVEAGPDVALTEDSVPLPAMPKIYAFET